MENLIVCQGLPCGRLLSRARAAGSAADFRPYALFGLLIGRFIAQSPTLDDLDVNVRHLFTKLLTMHIRSFLLLFVVAGSVHASDDIEVGHKSDSTSVKPMAWRLPLLEKAKDVFDKRLPEKAPGATISFRLPKVDASEGGNQVEIVSADRRIALTMLSNTTFVLGQDTPSEGSDALVVVNRNFPKGQFNHPLVQVRSPGLQDGVRRMGDLRLACEAQAEMAKEEGLKFRAALGAASLFGFSLCKKLEVTKLDGPAGKYDTVTIEDSNRRLVQSAGDKNPVELGDNAWSDDALISYTLSGSPVK